MLEIGKVKKMDFKWGMEELILTMLIMYILGDH